MDFLGKPDKVQPISVIVRNKKTRQAFSGSGYNPKNASKMLIYDDSDVTCDAASFWVKGKIDVRHGGIYVSIDRYKIHGNRPNGYIDNMLGVLEYIDEDTDIEIIGVKTAMLDKVRESDRWTALGDYVKDKFEAWMKAEDVADKISTYGAFDQFRDDSYDYEKQTLVDRCRSWTIADESSPIGSFIKMIQVGKEDQQIADKVRPFCQRLSIDLNGVGQPTHTLEDYKEAYKAVVEAYPILKGVQFHKVKTEEIEAYFDMVHAHIGASQKS
jgi:hypothetical protein